MRVLELYSGIGGWSSALSLRGIEHTVVAAFDINTVANDVYAYNYGRKPSAKSLETVTVDYLNKLNADIWVMSPPCQPFTRNNETENRDNKDPRSRSFLHLIEQLQNLENPPKYIALENVVGFERSYCCELFIQAIRSMGYSLLQFHLTPTQFGIPNDRPRYYCIAMLNGALESGICPSSGDNVLTSLPGWTSPAAPLPLERYLERSSDLTDEEMVSKRITEQFLCFIIISPPPSLLCVCLSV